MARNLVYLSLWLVLVAPSLHARPLLYLEEFYRIHYQPHRSENSDYLRNIHWLRTALKKPWAPPIQALIPPKNEQEYRRYQQLLSIHLRYLIVKNTVSLAARFDKHQPVFYNRPFRQDILKSLSIAEYLYREALVDWNRVLAGYEVNLGGNKDRVPLEFLEKMMERIRVGELDYKRVILRRLTRIESHKKYFSTEE